MYADINDVPVVCKTSTTAVYLSDSVSSVIAKNQIEGECVYQLSAWLMPLLIVDTATHRLYSVDPVPRHWFPTTPQIR